MHGFCGILSVEKIEIDKKAFKKSINLADTMEIDSVSEDGFFSAVSYLDTAPLKGERIHKTDDLIFLFAGDLIGYKEIPWEEIETRFLKSNFNWFSTLKGIFAIAIYDIKAGHFFLISDVNAQIPIYHSFFDNEFVFSTDLSTFTTLKSVPQFNKEWLYEYLFYNFPIDTTTFFKKVKRIRPMTVISLNLESGSSDEIKYGEFNSKSKDIILGAKALDKCIKSFKSIIPKYYCDKKNLVAISGGFDSRTLLSLAPEKSNVETYTYGVQDSADLETVSTFIRKTGFAHKEIHFNKDYKKSLSNLIYDTVRLSGGIQPILRSTLLYVYRGLYLDNKNINVVMSGINGDFYRGWDLYSPVTSISSPAMKEFFRTGKVLLDEDMSIKMFGKDYPNYKEYIYKSIEKVKTLYGDPTNPVTKMNFTFNEVNPKYFGGEVAIASNYFTFRQPFSDKDLVKLAFSTECGHLGYLGRKKNERGTSYKAYTLQTKVIASNPRFKKTNIRGLPIILFTYGNDYLIKISRFFIRGLAYLKGYRKPQNDLEEWGEWFKYSLKDEFDNLLNDSSLILDYVNKNFMESVKKTKDIHFLSKLATTEIILNLIKNRWDIS